MLYALDLTVLNIDRDKRLSTSLRVARIRPQSRTNYAMLASLACRTKRSIEYIRRAAPCSALPTPGNEGLWLRKRGYAATCVALAALS